MADQTVVENSTLKRFDPRGEDIVVERIIPGETDMPLYYEHLGRYQFASSFVRGKAVLDVACGVGYGAPVLCNGGARKYVGVDISPDAIEAASDGYRCSENVSFEIGDACRLEGIEDASIDVVVSFETIEHLPEPAKFLACLRRVLLPGGVLIISTPNRTASDPSADLDWVPANPFHLREWSLAEFTQLMGDFFVVDQVLGQLASPSWKIAARRASGYRLLGWIKTCYRAGKALSREIMRSAPGINEPVPVEPIRRWHVPTYVVCVCRRPPQ